MVFVSVEESAQHRHECAVHLSWEDERQIASLGGDVTWSSTVHKQLLVELTKKGCTHENHLYCIMLPPSIMLML